MVYVENLKLVYLENLKVVMVYVENLKLVNLENIKLINVSNKIITYPVFTHLTVKRFLHLKF